VTHAHAERLPDDEDLLSRELSAGQANEAGEQGLVWLGDGGGCGGLPRLQGVQAGRVDGAVATEGDHEITEKADHTIYIPAAGNLVTPILSTIPLQLFAYHVACLRGCDVDKPRNLAKSVTVE